ncbi:MAG: hypothetical protein AAGE52_20950 [Myxococcota bacterium]
MKLKGLAPWLVLAMAGCAGGEPPITGGSFAVDAVPLPTIDQEAWELAPAGCEGSLSQEIEFGIAEGAPELVVGLTGGLVVCVDSFSAVESELTLVGPEGVDALWLGYMAALQEVESFAEGCIHPTRQQNGLDGHVGPAAYEPQPQPSLEGLQAPDGIVIGAEPQPQPSEGNGTRTGAGEIDMGEGAVDAPHEQDTETVGGPVRPDAV